MNPELLRTLAFLGSAVALVHVGAAGSILALAGPVTEAERRRVADENPHEDRQVHGDERGGDLVRAQLVDQLRSDLEDVLDALSAARLHRGASGGDCRCTGPVRTCRTS